jgi:hypothetical protein
MKTNIRTIPEFELPGDDDWAGHEGDTIPVHVASRAVSCLGQTCIIMLVAPQGRAKMFFLNALHSEKTEAFQHMLSAILADIPEQLHPRIRLKAALTKPLRATFAATVADMNLDTPIEPEPYPTCDDAPSLKVLSKMRSREDLTDTLLHDISRDLDAHFFSGITTEPEAGPDVLPESATFHAAESAEPADDRDDVGGIDIADFRNLPLASLPAETAGVKNVPSPAEPLADAVPGPVDGHHPEPPHVARPAAIGRTDGATPVPASSKTPGRGVGRAIGKCVMAVALFAVVLTHFLQ